MVARYRLPILSHDNRTFWTGGEQGALMIHHCDECGRYTHPPMPACEACSSRSVAARQVSGRGVLHSFTINYQPWFPENEVPFAFGVVELEEQTRLFVFTNIVGIDCSDIEIGLPVEVCFERCEDVWLPLFKPVGVA